MDWLALTLFYGATTISMVECGCFGFRPLTKNFNNLCKKWWDKAYEEYNGMPSDRKSCIDLIVENCPEMITIKSSVKRSFDVSSLSHETWTTTVTASLKANPGVWMTYKEQEKKSLCFDDGVQECNYWWKIATTNSVDSETREVCIIRIFKHCTNKIVTTREETTYDLPSKRGYDVVTVAYKYDGVTTTYSRYVRQKNF